MKIVKIFLMCFFYIILNSYYLNVFGAEFSFESVIILKKNNENFQKLNNKKNDNNYYSILINNEEQTINTQYKNTNIQQNNSNNQQNNSNNNNKKKLRDTVKTVENENLKGVENSRLGRIPKEKPKYIIPVCKDPISALKFNKDGSIIAIGTKEGEVYLFNIATLKLSEKVVPADKREIVGIGFLDGDDSYNFIVVSYESVEAILYDMSAGTIIEKSEVLSIAGCKYTNALYGELLFIVGKDNAKQIEIINSNSNKVIRRYNGHTDIITSLAVSESAGMIVSTSVNNEVITWDGVSGKVKCKNVNSSSGYSCITMEPSGKNVYFSTFYGKLMGMKVDGCEIESIYLHAVSEFYSVAVSPDGSQIAGGNGRGKLLIFDKYKPKEDIKDSKGNDDVFVKDKDSKKKNN